MLTFSVKYIFFQWVSALNKWQKKGFFLENSLVLGSSSLSIFVLFCVLKWILWKGLIQNDDRKPLTI